jgi:hypothetical protein
MKRKKNISVGATNFYCTIAVLALSLYFFDLKIALYTAISMWVGARITDSVIEGFNRNKSVTIISDRSSEIAVRIMNEVDRGVTYLEGHGAYTGEPKRLINCVVSHYEIAKLKEIVLEVDRDAFILSRKRWKLWARGYSIKAHEKHTGTVLVCLQRNAVAHENRPRVPCAYLPARIWMSSMRTCRPQLFSRSIFTSPVWFKDIMQNPGRKFTRSRRRFRVIFFAIALEPNHVISVTSFTSCRGNISVYHPGVQQPVCSSALITRSTCVWASRSMGLPSTMSAFFLISIFFHHV